jgi:hypothetical protein
MSHDKVVIQDLYVREPPGWFQRVGNGPWENKSLELFGGKLPVVWLKDVPYTITETWEAGAQKE